MSNLGLVTITHDPSGRYINLFQKHIKSLATLYDEIYITISNQSNKDWKAVVKGAPGHYRFIPKNGVAHARREAVRFGLSGECTSFHYVDLDRLLTWVDRHKKELYDMTKIIPYHPYTIFGRTETAFLTHPEEWIETERITNRICSLELNKKVDITAGSCSFSRECAKAIIQYSTTSMTDAEWAFIVFRKMQLPIHYIATEGLEYSKEINSMNKEVSDAEKWLVRLRLAYIISESALNTGKE